MKTAAFPLDAARDGVAIVGKSGSGVPAFRRDPHLVVGERACAHCGCMFAVARKYQAQRFCSRRCVVAATRAPDHNAKISRASAAKRGDMQRGRGEGKTYPKLGGRHAHRVIAELTIGRPLRPGEVVHHRDHNRANFEADNLDVLPSQAEHARIHTTGVKHSPDHVAKRTASRLRTLAAKRAARAASILFPEGVK